MTRNQKKFYFFSVFNCDYSYISDSSYQKYLEKYIVNRGRKQIVNREMKRNSGVR